MLARAVQEVAYLRTQHSSPSCYRASSARYASLRDYTFEQLVPRALESFGAFVLQLGCKRSHIDPEIRKLGQHPLRRSRVAGQHVLYFAVIGECEALQDWYARMQERPSVRNRVTMSAPRN